MWSHNSDLNNHMIGLSVGLTVTILHIVHTYQQWHCIFFRSAVHESANLHEVSTTNSNVVDQYTYWSEYPHTLNLVFSYCLVCLKSENKKPQKCSTTELFKVKKFCRSTENCETYGQTPVSFPESCIAEHVSVKKPKQAIGNYLVPGVRELFNISQIPECLTLLSSVNNIKVISFNKLQ